MDMGHTHLQSVLIFYSWTAVVAVGCFSFLFLPWYGSTIFIGVGFVVCTFLTLGPLRKRYPLRREAEVVAEAVSDTKGLPL